jgi:hypothetical protein
MWTTDSIKTADGTVKANNPKIDDLVFDIALGITKSQLVGDTTLGNKKTMLNPRTNLHKDISKILEDSNYKDFYKWDKERIFTRDGITIEVVKYDITTSDMCLVKMSGKEVKMTKKQLREWYEE